MDFRKQKLETPISKRLTNYVAISAPHAIFDGSQSTEMGNVTDGISNTIMLAETRKHSVQWMQPEDVSPEEILAELQAAEDLGQANERNAKCSAIHGLNFLIGDGTVRFLSPQIDSATFHGLVTRDGNEVKEAKESQ